MSKNNDIIKKSIINLHNATGEEWISLKDIWEEAKKYYPSIAEETVRRTVYNHCETSDAFLGKHMYICKEKGTGLYKYIEYDRLKFIKNNISIGDKFTREQLMNIFCISGQAGMMKTNTLEALVLTTSEESVYGDSAVEDGTIQYTGEGLEGDQTLTKNNNTLLYSKEQNIPVYLFTKDKKRKYILKVE